MSNDHTVDARIQGVSGRALNAAVLLYTRWEAERAHSPLDRIVSAFFRSRRDLNSGERRWISNTIFNAVRFLRRDQFLLVSAGLDDNPENRVQIAAAPVPEPGPLPTSAQPGEFLRITLSFSDAMADELEAVLGPDSIAAASALNEQAPTTLRVNTLRTTREYVLSQLGDAAPASYSPWGITLPRRVNITDVPGFREGRFEVQEEASQIAAILCNVKPGQVVVDVGAGAGGKTLALAAMMRNQGRIVAIDTSAARLAELQKRAHRAGATCIETCLVATTEDDEWQPTGREKRTMNRLFRSADCVLLDAPCTGSGIIRRSPDLKWREFDVEAVTSLQNNLIAQAAQFVKPGGVLVYVTCAIERAQNEQVVSSFLSCNDGLNFTLSPLDARTPDGGEPIAARSRGENANRDFTDGIKELMEQLGASATTQGPGMVRTWPHLHGLDAFFIAKMQRRNNILVSEVGITGEPHPDRENN